MAKYRPPPIFKNNAYGCLLDTTPLRRPPRSLLKGVHIFDRQSARPRFSSRVRILQTRRCSTKESEFYVAFVDVISSFSERRGYGGRSWVRWHCESLKPAARPTQPFAYQHFSGPHSTGASSRVQAMRAGSGHPSYVSSSSLPSSVLDCFPFRRRRQPRMHSLYSRLEFFAHDLSSGMDSVLLQAGSDLLFFAAHFAVHPVPAKDLGGSSLSPTNSVVVDEPRTPSWSVTLPNEDGAMIASVPAPRKPSARPCSASCAEASCNRPEAVIAIKR